MSFSDLGLDQFIVKRYDGKVRSGRLCDKEDGQPEKVLIIMS